MRIVTNRWLITEYINEFFDAVRDVLFLYLLYLCFHHASYNRPVNLSVPMHTVFVIHLYLFCLYNEPVIKRGTAKGCAGAFSHSDVSTTMNVYAHATREAKRESAKLLDKVVGMN